MEKDGDLCATGSATLVYYDHTQLKPIAISEVQRANIARLEGCDPK